MNLDMLRGVADDLDRYGDEIENATKKLTARSVRKLREHLLKKIRDKDHPTYDTPCGLHAIDNWK